jgi:hypothetical protein
MRVGDRVKRWFAAPVFEGDEEKTRTAGLLNQAIATSLLLSVLIFIGAVIGNNVPSSAKLIAATWIIVLLLSRMLLHRGKANFVAFILTFLFFVFLTAANISLGTVRTPTAAIYTLWVILVGMLFKLPGMVVATISSSLAILGLVVAENAGLLPTPDYSVGITQWMKSKRKQHKPWPLWV